MNKEHRNNKLSQSTLAYIIFIGVVILAFAAMSAKLRQKTQSSYKDSADVFSEGRQFGSFTTTGGVTPFKFPDLPPGTTATLPPEGLPPVLPCNAAQLNAINAAKTTMLSLQARAEKSQKDAEQKREDAKTAQEYAGEVGKLAAQKWQEAGIARQKAR